MNTAKIAFRLRLGLLAVTYLPAPAPAQQDKCPAGYQPYANRCVSQRMADFISCIEASGGNREELSKEVSRGGDGRSTGVVSGKGSASTTKGSGVGILDKSMEESVASKIKERWYSNAMAACSTILENKPSKLVATPKPQPTTRTRHLSAHELKQLTNFHGGAAYQVEWPVNDIEMFTNLSFSIKYHENVIVLSEIHFTLASKFLSGKLAKSESFGFAITLIDEKGDYVEWADRYCCFDIERDILRRFDKLSYSIDTSMTIRYAMNLNRFIRQGANLGFLILPTFPVSNQRKEGFYVRIEQDLRLLIVDYGFSR